MKDMTDYIVKDGKSFWVDVEDIDTGETLWEDNEVFAFTYDGVEYKGSAVDNGEDEVMKVRISK